jgi:hypothetical protein
MAQTEAIFRDDVLLKRCHLEIPAFLHAGRLLEKYFSIPANHTPIWHKSWLPFGQPDTSTKSIPLLSLLILMMAVLVEVSDLIMCNQAGTPFESQSLSGVSSRHTRERCTVWLAPPDPASRPSAAPQWALPAQSGK